MNPTPELPHDLSSEWDAAQWLREIFEIHGVCAHTAEPGFVYVDDARFILAAQELEALRATIARVKEAAWNEGYPCGCGCEGIHTWQIRRALGLEPPESESHREA